VGILKNPQHVEKIRQVFRAANDKRLAIVAHLWTDQTYEETGREHAEVFLKQILPAAPDITVQIAHMAGGGRSTDSALAVFAEAIATGDPRAKNLYFDVATLTGGQSEEGLRKDVLRMRRIGLKRILYGTDMTPPHPPALQSWATFRARMPLAEEEFRIIAGNVAPYLR
jgi:predicted TIM-barrel fold metal-dependent hydrolase